MENKSTRFGGGTEHKGNRRGNPLFQLALVVGYMAGIYGLSSIPGNIDPEDAAIYGIIAWTPPALQNLLHVPLFGLLAWLWYRTLEAWSMQHGAALTAACMLAVVYGAIDEWHQLHVPGRYASFTDIALNCAGAVLALWWIHCGKRSEARPETGKRPDG
jgi:hypothetical protein